MVKNDLNSLTQKMKIFISSKNEANDKDDKDDIGILNSNDLLDTANSIFDISEYYGMSLQEYVEKNSKEALYQAEFIHNKWLKLQSNIIYKAFEGEATLSREIVKLIQTNLLFSEKHLEQVKEYIYNSILKNGTKSDNLINILYNRAVNNSDSKALYYLIDRLEGRIPEIKYIDQEFDNRLNIYNILCSLFDKQLEVLNSGNGTKLVCCSRRSGKSVLGCAAMLIESLRVADTSCIYISETAELGYTTIVTPTMNEIITKSNLTDSKGNRLRWESLENNSRILVRGLHSIDDLDLLRGNKAKVVVIDEFFHLRDNLLSVLHSEILQPMQMDYATDYKFLCLGTPPSRRGSFGEYAWNNWNCNHFTWTYKDNPYPLKLEDREKYIDNILIEKGISRDSIFIRREYNCEWVYDDDLLLYPDFVCYNEDKIPSYNVDMVLFGMDYGISDCDTLVGIAWNTSDRCGYIFHEDKFNRLDMQGKKISQLQYLHSCVKKAWEKAVKFFPTYSLKEANKRILWSADDNNQHVTDDLNINVHLDGDPKIRLNIQNAHKTDKVMMFDKIRDLLRSGCLLLPEGGETKLECQKTVLLRGGSGEIYPEVNYKIYHPDILPAVRYALWNVIGCEVYNLNN